MGSLAFIVSGIEQSEESRIYQFRAATPAEVQAADVEGLEVPGRFRFAQVIDPAWSLGDGEQFFITLGIAIDPYGCVTIPTATIAELVDGAANGYLPLIVLKPGEDMPYAGRIQLEDYVPLDDDPVPATKVGDMVVFTADDSSN